MSASDAAPLPRLGEVFFDVRGESRTMRLSWYADTGVAVFSIWQGGTCTGTFRLPIPDLPRMVEALQRGPHARDGLSTGEQPGSRERRPPAVPAQRGPARSSRHELLDGDIATGQSAAGRPPGPDVTGYQAEPPLPGYAGEPALPGHPDPPGYTDEAARPGHPDPPGYANEAARPGHPEGRQPYPGEPGTAYGDGPPLAGGAGYPAGLAEPAEDFTAGYEAERTPDFAAERGPRYARPPTGRRSGGHRAPAEAGYPEEMEPYPGEPGGAGYADEPPDGYLGDDTLLAPGYPAYPAEHDDFQRYPEEPAGTDYDSPVRPYVTDTGDIDEPFAEEPPERPKPRGRGRAGHSPDSFPYGPPPAGDEPRQRGPYPGRH